MLREILLLLMDLSIHLLLALNSQTELFKDSACLRTCSFNISYDRIISNFLKDFQNCSLFVTDLRLQKTFHHLFAQMSFFLAAGGWGWGWYRTKYSFMSISLPEYLFLFTPGMKTNLNLMPSVKTFFVLVIIISQQKQSL